MDLKWRKNEKVRLIVNMLLLIEGMSAEHSVNDYVYSSDGVLSIEGPLGGALRQGPPRVCESSGRDHGLDDNNLLHLTSAGEPYHSQRHREYDNLGTMHAIQNN